MKAPRYIKMLLALAAAALAAASCIYPFDPELDKAKDWMVIEGDILIGEITTIKVSRVFDQGEGYDPDGSAVDVSIESEDGKIYEGKAAGAGTGFGSGTGIRQWSVDLTEAADNVRYRLKVHDTGTGRHYSTEWLEAMEPAKVEGLSHRCSEDENGVVSIMIDIQGTENARYFKLSNSEEWEFHSQYRATHYYEQPDAMHVWGQILPFTEGRNTYYCWQSQKSSNIDLVRTDTYNDNRLKGHEFKTVSRTSRQLQEVYHIRATIQTLDLDGYRFWNNIYDNSYRQGDLFSPTPSSMRGNIRCEEDPDEMVIGYISCGRRAVSDLYIDNRDTGYCTFKKDGYYSDKDPLNISFNEYWGWYYVEKRYRPYTVENDGARILWLPKECVDCREMGGTKNKPKGWPRPEI